MAEHVIGSRESRDGFIREITRIENELRRKIDDLVVTDGCGLRAKGFWGALSQGCHLLAAIASCHYGCLSKHHEIENIVRRLVNAVLGSIRLVRCGYVDESILMLRTASEYLNLLQLFSIDPVPLERWRISNERFKPGIVRKELARLGVEPDYTESAYAALCSPYVHPVPLDKQQRHSLKPQDKLYVGPILPIPGIACVFTEAGYCVEKALQHLDAVFRLPAAHRRNSKRLRAALNILIADGQFRAYRYRGSLVQFWASQI